MQHRLSRIALAGLLAASALAAHAQLYKWVDADGKVQYTDTPPPANAKNVTAIRTGPGSATPAPAANSVSEQEKAFQKRRADAAKNESKSADDAKSAAAKQQRCTEAKSYMATLNDGGRIVRTNEKGEREFLDEATIESEKKRAQAAIAEACATS